MGGSVASTGKLRIEGLADAACGQRFAGTVDPTLLAVGAVVPSAYQAYPEPRNRGRASAEKMSTRARQVAGLHASCAMRQPARQSRPFVRCCKPESPALGCCARNGASGPVRKRIGGPQPVEAQNRDLAMGPVGIGIVVEACFIGPFNGRRKAGERPTKALHYIGLRPVVAAKRDPVAYAVQRHLR